MRILPIGTVVKLKNEKIKVMIIARMMTLTIGEEKFYYDYSGCMYPRGLVGNKVANFNEEDIEEVLFEGFVDDEEQSELQKIENWLVNTDVKRADLNMIRDIITLKKLAEEESNNK